MDLSHPTPEELEAIAAKRARLEEAWILAWWGVPDPASEEARSKGCTCPSPGQRDLAACPLHGLDAYTARLHAPRPTPPTPIPLSLPDGRTPVDLYLARQRQS